MNRTAYSGYLRVGDAVSVMRAVSDIRDLRRDPEAQRLLLTDSVVELLDARQGFSVVFRDLTPTGSCTPEDVVARAEAPEALEEFLNWWSDAPRFDPREDPLVDAAGRAGGRRLVQAPGISMDPETFQNNRAYELFAGPIGMVSVAAASFDISKPGEPRGTRAAGLSMHRMKGQRGFTRRELGRLELLADELQRLASVGELPCLTKVEQVLTPRQREIGRCMREGLGAKQIARQLGLSTHTVYSYCKDLYRRIGVSDRMEAVAAFDASPDLLSESAGELVRMLD